MRSATAILFLATLTVPFLALYLRNCVEIKQVRKEIKERMVEGLSRDQLVTLSFASADTDLLLDWEHSREFKYNDQMYDVVETIPDGDTIHYIVWWDHAETALVKQLDNLMANLLLHDPVQQSKQHTFTDFFKNLFCEQPFTSNLCESINRKHSYFDKTHLPYIVGVSPPVPPPWPAHHHLS